MAEDPLDRDVSVSLALTQSGVTASAKSRVVAGLDRLAGNLVDALNIPLERRNERARAQIEGEKALAEATIQHALERIGADPEFARRVLDNHLGGLLRKQENKDAVVREVVEQLKALPPTEEEATSGPETLDDAFMDRFEKYAEEASTSALREKWARVFSSEVRKPGTFSSKALRTVDEIDPDTARLFENVCKHRLEQVIPICLTGKLEFRETARLTEAGLLIDPGFAGQVRLSRTTQFQSGLNLEVFGFDIRGIGLEMPVQIEPTGAVQDDCISESEGSLHLPAYVLTAVGRAVASILTDNQAEAFGVLVEKVRPMVPRSEVHVLAWRQPSHWLRERVLPPLKPEDEASPAEQA